MNYQLHPEAAWEHEEQVAWYEARQPGLGRRYHIAVLVAISKACRSPTRFKIAGPLSIRRVPLAGFPFAVLYREAGASIQVLAIAHYRRSPNYWGQRA